MKKQKIKPQVELKNIENLLYNIFSKVLDNYEFYIDKMNDKIDQIEDKVLENPSNEIMSEIFLLKKIFLTMRKIIEPQKNVYSYFTREVSPFISKKSIAYFRDIFYQYDRLSQTILSFNQIISSFLEVYVSRLEVQLNQIIKFLTIIATIFMPAVLITSYYGMNVAFPEHTILGSKYAWYFVFFLIIASTLAVYFYIKRKKWF